MPGPEAESSTPSGIRDGDPAALAAFATARGPAVLSYTHAVCPPPLALRAAAEAFARFRAAVSVLGDLPGVDHEALLLGATRRATADACPPAQGGLRSVVRRGCAEVPALLAARLEGELGPEDAERLARHLARDPACRAIEARFLAAEREFADPPRGTPAPDVTAALVGALAAAAPLAGVAAGGADVAGPQATGAPAVEARPDAVAPEAAPPPVTALAPTAEPAREVTAQMPPAPAEAPAAAPPPPTAPPPAPPPDRRAATPDRRSVGPDRRVTAPDASGAADGPLTADAPVVAEPARTGPALAEPALAPRRARPPAFARARRHRPVHEAQHGVVRTVVLPLSVVGVAAIAAMAIAGVFGEDGPQGQAPLPPITAPVETIPPAQPRGTTPRDGAPAAEPPDVVRGNGEGEDALGGLGVPGPGVAGPAEG